MNNRFLWVGFASMFWTLSSFAQQVPVHTPSLHASYLKNLFGVKENTNKSRAAQRTTGQSTTDNSLQTFTDSVQVSYGPGGLSYFDFNMLNYAYNDPFQSSPLFEYAGNFCEPQIEHQQLKRWTVNPNTLTYGFYQTQHTSYDPNLNLMADTTLYADSSILPNRICKNTFSASNKIKGRYENNWKAGKSDSAAKRLFLYDAQDRLIRDSIYHYVSGTWKLFARTVYTYSLSAQPTKISHYTRYFDSTYTKPLAEVLRYDNTYDAQDRLLTVRTRYYDGNSLLPYVIDSFAYAPGVSFHTSWKQFQFDPINNNWHKTSFMHKKFNASNLPDTVYLDTYDSLKKKWVPYIRYNLTYDVNDNPIRLDEYAHNFVAFTANSDFTTRFYYENISTTTPVTALDKPEISLNVFPNPCFGSASLEISGLHVQSREEAVLKILDSGGRVVVENKILPGGNTLLIEGLMPGAYLYGVYQKDQIVASGRLLSLSR